MEDANNQLESLHTCCTDGTNNQEHAVAPNLFKFYLCLTLLDPMVASWLTD